MTATEVRFAITEDRRFALPFRIVILDETGQPFMTVTGSPRRYREQAEKLLAQIEDCPLCRRIAAAGDHPGTHRIAAYCATGLAHCSCSACRGEE